MKLKIKSYAKWCLICLAGLIFLQPVIVVAQSETSNESADSVADCSRFSEAATSELPVYRYVFEEDVVSFIKEINELGKCGYRLDNLTDFPLDYGKTFFETKIAAIVKLDAPNRYEYDWFEAFTSGELTTRLNYRAKKGFRLRDSLDSVSKACGHSPNQTDMMGNNFGDVYVKSGNLFFLERKNDAVVELADNRVVIGRWGWGKSVTKELQRNLETTAKVGFNPINMGFANVENELNAFLVMTKNDSVSGQPAGNNLTYKVLKSEYGFEKKVNRLAQEGFKILFYDTYGVYGFVTMTKAEQPSDLVSYHWVDVLDDDWQDEISNLSKQGAVYKSLGVTATNLYCTTFEGKLMFEKPLTDNGKRYEYKILKMSERTHHITRKQTPRRLTPTKEELQEFDKLVKDGYVISDVFYEEGITVLFEREK